MNSGIMKIVFESITNITKNNNSILILDQHPSHTTDFVKDEAIKRNIKLIYIPKGLTSKYQPLNLKINGIIKAYAKKLWRISGINDPTKKFKVADSIEDLLKFIKIIEKETIIKSFNI